MQELLESTPTGIVREAVMPTNLHETLADRVYLGIKRALLSGGFVPGQKLTIREISRALGVSMTPAREALGRLVAERSLVSTPNRSVYVPQLTQARLREIYQLRRMLEGHAAEQAAANIGQSEIAELEQVQIELVAAMDRTDYRQVLLKSYYFHFGIYSAADLPLAVQIIETLWVQIGPSLNFLYPEYNQERTGVTHHSEALIGLRAGDPLAVRKAIEDDLSDGERQLIKKLDEKLPEIPIENAFN
jgi:DNA-binding GntR family transcriptional regulator